MRFAVNLTIDKIGRIFLPKYIRNCYGINKEDILEIILTEKGIFIKKSLVEKNNLKTR